MQNNCKETENNFKKKQNVFEVKHIDFTETQNANKVSKNKLIHAF